MSCNPSSPSSAQRRYVVQQRKVPVARTDAQSFSRSTLQSVQLPPGIRKVCSKEDEAAVARVVSRAFAGNAEAAPELGLDWVMGPQLEGKWDLPLRMEILSWMTNMCCSAFLSGGGLALMVGEDSQSNVEGMALCGVMEPVIAGCQAAVPIPELPGFRTEAERCPQGHALVQTITPRANFRCDSCSRRWAAGTTMLSCRSCDFDVCTACSSKAAGRMRSAMNGRLDVLSRVQLERHERHLRCTHLHIGLIGVEPASQGKGLCSRLLRALCTIADQLQLPTYIETSGRKNADIYARFGFEIVEEYNVSWPQDPERSDVLQHMFAMVRPVPLASSEGT